MPQKLPACYFCLFPNFETLTSTWNWLAIPEKDGHPTEPNHFECERCHATVPGYTYKELHSLIEWGAPIVRGKTPVGDG